MILARGGGNLKNPIFISSNSGLCPGKVEGGGDVEVSSGSAHKNNLYIIDKAIDIARSHEITTKQSKSVKDGYQPRT